MKLLSPRPGELQGANASGGLDNNVANKETIALCGDKIFFYVSLITE